MNRKNKKTSNEEISNNQIPIESIINVQIAVHGF